MIDTDGDLYTDALEILKGTDYLNPRIHPECCKSYTLNTVGYGCTNAQEYDFSTDLADPNSYDLSCYNGGCTGAAVTEIGASSTTFTILIISVFVLIGSAIIYTLWRRKQRF